MAVQEQVAGAVQEQVAGAIQEQVAGGCGDLGSSTRPYHAGSRIRAPLGCWNSMVRTLLDGSHTDVCGENGQDGRGVVVKHVEGAPASLLERAEAGLAWLGGGLSLVSRRP